MVHCKKNKETKKVNIITEDVLWTCVYVKIKTKQKTLKLKNQVTTHSRKIQQIHKLYPLSLMYYCWKSVTMFGCNVVESRMFQLVQFTKINYRKQKAKKNANANNTMLLLYE